MINNCDQECGEDDQSLNNPIIDNRMLNTGRNETLQSKPYMNLKLPTIIEMTDNRNRRKRKAEKNDFFRKSWKYRVLGDHDTNRVH